MQLRPSAAGSAAAAVLHRCGLVPGVGCMPCCQGDAGTELAEPRGSSVSSCLFGIGQEPAHPHKQIPSGSHSALE